VVTFLNRDEACQLGKRPAAGASCSIQLEFKIMSLAEDQSRRRGGREARKAMRARPVPLADGAVRPGMVGGQYKPLTQLDMERIHETALKLLKQWASEHRSPSCVKR